MAVGIAWGASGDCHIGVRAYVQSIVEKELCRSGGVTYVRLAIGTVFSPVQNGRACWTRIYWKMLYETNLLDVVCLLCYGRHTPGSGKIDYE